MKSNLTQKIAYNAFFSAGARIIDMALALIIIRITAGYLKESGFGDYTIVMTFVYIFSVIADMGLYSIVVREISRDGADEEKIINNALTMRSVLGFFILGSAYFAGLLFPYSIEVKNGIAVAALGFWLLSNVQVLTGLFQKHLAVDRLAISEMGGRVTQLFFVWYFASNNYGFLYIVLSVFLGSVINFFLVLLFASKYVKIGAKFDLSFWKELLREAFPLAVSAILVLIYFKLSTIFLSVMKDSQAVGVYGLSYKIMENLIFFPAMIVGLAVPVMSKYIFTDREKFKSVVQRTMDFIIIAVVPVIFGVAMTSDKIIGLLSSPNGFKDSPLILNILMVALGFIFFGALFSNIIIVANMQNKLAKIYLAGTVFNVMASFIFIPKYSYFGAAAITVATEFLVTVLMIVTIRKTLKYIPSFAVFYKAIAVSFVMAAVIYYFNYLNVFYLIALGGLIYIPGIYLVGGISREEIRKILNKAE
ncbi:MAG: flippase [Minisyncoccia bacterium]